MGRWPNHPVNATTAIVCSKMNSGAFLFVSVATTQLNKLDVIQNQALRRILGAIKTTPIAFNP